MRPTLLQNACQSGFDGGVVGHVEHHGVRAFQGGKLLLESAHGFRRCALCRRHV
jgi:hypothetical protein